MTTFLLNHFDLFGLRQVYAAWRDRKSLPLPFATPFLYRLVRHPLYVGFLIAFWATPVMTVTHFVFAAASTAYVLVGIQLEERDLIHQFGDSYRAYRTRVRMLLPWPRRPRHYAQSPNAARGGKRQFESTQ